MRIFIRTIIILLLVTKLSLAQNHQITPGGNLVVDGIPPVPAELAVAVSRYTGIESTYITGWHPIKRELLVRTRARVFAVATPGGARASLAFIPSDTHDVYYHPLSSHFVVSRDRNGDEFFQLYTYGDHSAR